MYLYKKKANRILKTFVFLGQVINVKCTSYILMSLYQHRFFDYTIYKN